MAIWKWLFSLLLIFLTSLTFAAEKAIVLRVNGPIGPATQDYIVRNLALAAKEKASVVILELNTPGGLETSMRGISEAIVASPVPVITYVSPSGARAASAGTFILYASHIAAMAPGTNVGAASPVNLVSSGEKTKELTTQEKKAVNDASAYIRSLAQLRGRNISWAESSVRQAASISSEEAKQLKVVDEIAENYPQLLQKVDGKTVIVQGVAKKMNTKNLELKSVSPDWRYEFLSFITNPNIVYILIMIAVYGLFFELSNPGLVLPGVAGVISLLLVLYAFQLLPINYAGLTLILIGIAFMVFEVYVSSFGAIGVGGVIAFVIGSIMLFDVEDPNYRLTWTMILTMSAFTLAFFFVVVTIAIRSHKKAIVTGQEGLIGSEGVVVTQMNEQVIVRVLGEMWDARANVLLKPGEHIKVTGIKGLTLHVEPKEKHRKKD